MCKSLLGGGKAPAPIVLPEAQAPAAAPQEGDAAVTQARQDERRRRLKAQAANDTLVTGGQGAFGSTNTGGGQLYGN